MVLYIVSFTNETECHDEILLKIVLRHPILSTIHLYLQLNLLFILFKGTGNLNDIGIGKGQYYTVNVPLHDGIRDAEFTPLVCRYVN